MGLCREIERYKDELDNNSDIYADDILFRVPKKFHNAQNSYAGTGCIAFLYDATLFGSATEGFAITGGEISFCINGRKGRGHFNDVLFSVYEDQNRIGFYSSNKGIDITFPVSSLLIKRFQLLEKLISRNREW